MHEGTSCFSEYIVVANILFVCCTASVCRYGHRLCCCEAAVRGTREVQDVCMWLMTRSNVNMGLFCCLRQSTQAIERSCKYCIRQFITFYKNAEVCTLIICINSHGRSAVENGCPAIYQVFNETSRFFNISKLPRLNLLQNIWINNKCTSVLTTYFIHKIITMFQHVY